MKQSILIVDDDLDLINLLRTKLEKDGFDISTALDGEEGLSRAQKKPPDLIVLDVKMPGRSGLDVCKNLKEAGNTKIVPVIMLTSKNEEMDRILGLELGADDYLSKPFSYRELLLRIKSILRRTSTKSAKQKRVTKLGDLTVDFVNHEVWVGKEKIHLTLTEFNLFAALMESPGQVKTREFLLEKIWDYNDGVYSRTVDTHVQRLRSKLLEAGHAIETIRGVGYRFNKP